ncbi:hypothetical protein [Streptomyces sp. NPDC002187]|uniref:hypothetical protein n=1 Tax=Streptomyces sp. NPDC002187 TaxID=3364637 RepID=UPI003689A309
MKLVVADKDQKSVPCDGVRATHRIQRAPAVLPIDITAESGATGMVAWEITSVAD